MDKNGLAHWAFAFVFTQIIEVPIYMRGLRVGPLKAFGASALTHRVVWFVIPALWAALYRFAAARYSARSRPRFGKLPARRPSSGLRALAHGGETGGPFVHRGYTINDGSASSSRIRSAAASSTRREPSPYQGLRRHD